MHPNDVVVTGLPRGGTTLTCELLNQVEGTVALDEPMDKTAWIGSPSRVRKLLGKRAPKEKPRPLDAPRFVRTVEDYFDATRKSLNEGRGAISLNVGGEVFGGKFVDERSPEGLRQQVTKLGVIRLNEKLPEDFTLVIKHNAGFTVAVEHLAARFPTFAIVRNPLSTLSSWQTVKVPINRGRVRRAELVDPHLAEKLDDMTDVTDRQVFLLDWFFGLYRTHLPPASVIRYEDIVSTGGTALSPITPKAEALRRPMESRNRSSVYDADSMRRVAERLIATDGAWRDFYDNASIEALVS